MHYEDSLEMCPHMPASCPHKEDRCDHADSHNCHYILVATAAALTLAYTEEEDTPPGFEKRIGQAQTFVHKLDVRSRH